MALNQRVSAPYGDVYFADSPMTNAFIQSHNQQERQDQVMRERELSDLDKQMGQHLGNVLNPDIPEIMNAWQEYKGAKTNLLRNDRLNRDPQQYAQAQIDANSKLAKAMQLIADSSTRKKMLQDQVADWQKNPHKYDDNFSDKVNMALATPTTFANQHVGFDNMRWQGVDADFKKKFAEAEGKVAQVGSRLEPVGETGEQSIPVTVKAPNNPIVYMNKLNENNTDRKYAYQAEKYFANKDPEEVKRINDAYAALGDDVFKKWGMPGKPNLEPTNPADPVQQLHALEAKAYALQGANRIVEERGRPVVNAEIRRQNQLKTWKEKLGLTDQQWYRHQKTLQANKIQLKSIPSASSGGKSKADEDETAWVTLGPEILRNGTPEQKEIYLNNLATGGGKGVNFVDAKAEAPEIGSWNWAMGSSNKKLPTVRYTKQTWVPTLDKDGNETKDGHWEDQIKTVQLNPDDPALQEKLVNLSNVLKGKNNKIIRHAYNMDKLKTTSQPSTDKKVDADKKAADLLKKYLGN